MGHPAGLRIVAAGDVVPTRPLGPDIDLPRPVLAALSELRTADVAIGTLEAPLTDRGQPCDKVVVYRAAPTLAEDVAAMGFSIVSLANNQTLNYGPEGLAQTIEVLELNGVRHVGAGPDAEAAWSPEVVAVGGVRVAFVACTCVAPLGWAATDERGGLAALRVRTAYEVDARWEQEEPGVQPRVRTWIEDDQLDRASRAVRRAGELADIVIVSVHWGVGASAERADYQLQLAHALVDAGATCVLGGHPPALQGLELINGSFVSFSQGTFVRQQPRNTADPALARLYDRMPRSGCLLKLDFGRDGDAHASVLPTWLQRCDRAGVVRGQEARGILEEIQRLGTLEPGRTQLEESTLELTIR